MSSESLDPRAVEARYQAKLAARAARTVDVIVTPAPPVVSFGGGDARFEAKLEARRLEFKAKAEAAKAKAEAEAAKAPEAPAEAKPAKPASDAKTSDAKPRG